MIRVPHYSKFIYIKKSENTHKLKKACNHLCLSFLLGYRQVTLQHNKQERPTPYRA